VGWQGSINACRVSRHSERQERSAIDGLLNDEATAIIGRDDEAKDFAGGKEDAVNLGIATKRTTLLEKVSELRETIVVGLLLADN
jgi:hypothetical protein